MLFDLRPKEQREELFGRNAELSEILRLLEAGRWVAVLGARMTGKSSIIKTAGTELSKQSFRFMYVNLLGVRSIDGFISAIADAINRSKTLLDKAKDFLSLVEGVRIGIGGLSLTVPRAKRPVRTAFEIFSALGSTKERIVVALDEVQELSSVSRPLLELLGRLFATHRNLLFLFTGSQFGLMRTLLEPGAESPLYGRPPAKIILQPFDTKTATEFLRCGFLELGMTMGETEIEEVLERLDGIPGWLTLYGSKAGVEKLPHAAALEEAVKDAEKIVVSELRNFLASRNKELYIAVLRAAAYGARWGDLKRAVEARVGVVNSARLAAALRSLKATMLLDEEEGLYRIIDPIVRKAVLTRRI